MLKVRIDDIPVEEHMLTHIAEDGEVNEVVIHAAEVNTAHVTLSLNSSAVKVRHPISGAWQLRLDDYSSRARQLLKKRRVNSSRRSSGGRVFAHIGTETAPVRFEE